MDQEIRIQALERQLAALHARIQAMFAFSRSERDPDEGGPVQRVQVRHSAFEVHDRVTRVQDYGLASVPPPGTDMLTMFMGGDRGAAVAFGSGNQAHRPRDLAPGDSCLHDNRGHRVQLAGGGVVIDAAGHNVTILNAGTVTINASVKVRLVTPVLEVTGEIIDRCDSDGVTMESTRNVYNNHHHPVTGIQTGGATVTSNIPNEQL